MRILLAALQCEKGDVARNLDSHRRVLHDAREAGCTVAVFPEMSLSGSVDPARHPERLLALDASAVEALTALTAETGVAAVFGIAERGDGDAAYITQIVAEHGRRIALQRKRHLGDDEERYTPVDVDEVFELDGVRCTIAICAESAVDRPFAHAAGAGADLVFYCAAPGLWGRRVDEASWQRGWDWWRGDGLANARRHARERGLWIAIATQAGSTDDEDFPGLAALVDVAGDVRAELPDWHAGTLIVEIPLRSTLSPAQ